MPILKPRTTLILIGLCVGACAAMSVARAQQLLNLPTQPAVNGSQSGSPVTEYNPKAPPLVDDPGTLEAPPLVARRLNETDAAYTQRMRSVQAEMEQQRVQLLQDHAALMKRVSQIGISHPTGRTR